MFADDIRAGVGGPRDLGTLPLITQSIEESQRFVISHDVLTAAAQLLETRPSSLERAMPLCRTPYDRMWLEWKNSSYAVPPPGAAGEDLVTQTGVHVASFNKGRSGLAFFCWGNARGDVACPGVGLAFDLSGNADNFYDAIGTTRPNPVSLADIRSRIPSDDPWAPLIASDDTEAQALANLSRYAVFAPNPWIEPAYKKVVASRGPEAALKLVRERNAGSMKEINGETPLLFALLMLINSCNAVSYETPDLDRLNKARRKIGKPPKYGHVVTRLALSRGMARRGEAEGLDRAAMRQHLVRGHFKIRRTGVYWWSPFVRGDAARPLARDRYLVKA